MLTFLKKGFSANALKYYAAFAMLIDHIAWGLVPTGSVLGQVMHIIGRTTAPIMCFFIAEGYFHTRNVKKYVARLAIFTVLFYSPFIISPQARAASLAYEGVAFPANVLLTLLCGLLALWAWDKLDGIVYKLGAVGLLCLISSVGDWPVFGVLFVLAFGLNHGNFKRQMLWFAVVALCLVTQMCVQYAAAGYPFYLQLFQLGLLLAIPILYLYNGERGRGGRFSKWFFYIFYPVHLLIIALIVT